MSELKVNSIKGVGASTAAITVNNSDGTCTANITNNLSNRNLLINGDFSVNQRGGTNTTINTYALDRWRSYGGPLGFTISQQNNISNGSLSSSKYAIRFQRTASNSQTNNTGIAQGVETLNCQGIAGTQVTLSFLARKGADMSDDLSYTIFFGQGTDESPVGMTSMTNSSSTSALTTSFVKYTKTVTVPANTSQITVGFTYDPTGTAGANDWFEIAECQLERGSVATDFEHPRSFGDELARCQRYYETHNSLTTAKTTDGSVTSQWSTITSNDSNTLVVSTGIIYKVPKRASPTVTIYNPSNTTTAARVNAQGTERTVTASYGGPNALTRIYVSGASAGNYVTYNWEASAEL